MNKIKSHDQVTIKNLEKSQVEITGSIPAEVLESHKAEAIKHLNESVKVDGFRPGMIPEKILISKIGEMALLEEMAEHALPQAYIDIIIENKIDAIGKPEIQVTKIAKNNPLEFKITTAVVPKIDLPDYRKISAEIIAKNKKTDDTVDDKEVEDAILKIRRSAAGNSSNSDNSETDQTDTTESVTTDGADKTNKESDTTNNKAGLKNSIDEKDLPELNDEFVKKIGPFENVANFKESLKKMLVEQKKDQAKEKLRIELADKISGETKTEMPEIMIQSELNRIESQFQDDIVRMGVKMEEYLKLSKKSMEDIRAEWRPHAEKKAKLQLILNAIAQKENLKADTAEIEQEVEHILEHYKDADQERASVYAETVLTNEKVFQFLENQNTK